MFKKLLFICTVVVLASGGRAPNADRLVGFRATPLGATFSDEIYEEAQLDVPDLITRHGYPVEIHHVITSDGYVLESHRIPHGKDKKGGGPKPVVFLMHGLLSSSADYVVLGPNVALAYIFADAGFDVWLGNARGNYYSRKHLRLNPERGNDFWKFSWEEIGLYDIPAFVDHILEVTGESQLHYVGHSQGGTVFLVLNSLKPEYNAKFKSFHGFAPASFFNYNEHPIYVQLAKFERIIETTVFTLGTGEILTNQQAQTLISAGLCDNKSIFDAACVEKITESSNTFKYMNSTILPLLLSNAPAGASIRQVAHYAQSIRRGAFARFDHSLLTNLLLYGQRTPPDYDLSKVTVPSYLYYGLSDLEVNYRDLHLLASKLPNVIETFRVERQSFNHFDFIWGPNVLKELYKKVLGNFGKSI